MQPPSSQCPGSPAPGGGRTGNREEVLRAPGPAGAARRPRAGSASPQHLLLLLMSFKSSNWATVASASRTSTAFPLHGKQEHQGTREVVSLPPSCDPRSGQRSTSPAAFPQRPGRRAGYWLPRALHCLSLVWRVEGPVSRCPYSPCRSPSLEKGFHYTSESVSSGLKSDPDGLSCIWALFFVGPKVAGLRNACCLGLFQIKSRIFRVHVLTRPEPGLGAPCPLRAQPGGECIQEEQQVRPGGVPAEAEGSTGQRGGLGPSFPRSREVEEPASPRGPPSRVTRTW